MGIIEAAHVIPHSHDLGSDHIQNGIALCPNHHRMFDSGLIGLSETYKILVNWKRVEYLEKFKISEGTGDLKTIENSGIRLPVSTDAMPTADNIKTANKIRGVFWD
jgi:putative restriction endonuclease